MKSKKLYQVVDLPVFSTTDGYYVLGSKACDYLELRETVHYYGDVPCHIYPCHRVSIDTVTDTDRVLWHDEFATKVYKVIGQPKVTTVRQALADDLDLASKSIAATLWNDLTFCNN